MNIKDESFVQKGDKERDAQNWAEAADAYQRAVDQNPALWHIWVQLGHALKESGSISAATVAYKNAVRIRQDDADAHYQLAVGLQMQGRYIEAVKSVETAVALKPNLTAARALMADLFRSVANENPNTVEIKEDIEIIETARYFEIVRSLIDHGSEGYALFAEKPFQENTEAK